MLSSDPEVQGCQYQFFLLIFPLFFTVSLWKEFHSVSQRHATTKWRVLKIYGCDSRRNSCWACISFSGLNKFTPLRLWLSLTIIIIIRCQIWNRHWRPCLSKHLCHQTTSKNLNTYFVHLLPSYKDYQEMLFFICPLSRLPSTFPVKDKNSKPLRLHTCPKNSICLFLIVFNSDLWTFPSLNTFTWDS